MILVFGSTNLDIIHTLPTLPKPGETVTHGQLGIEPGGKGANQAAAAARDGAAVAFASAVGRDAWADLALAGLDAAGIDLARVARTGTPTGIASICVDAAGQNQIAVSSGANLHATADQVADADLTPATTLVLQMEVDPAQTAALIRRARNRGARIILNLAPAAPLPEDALRQVDWLIVNETEAAWLQTHLAGRPPASLGPGLIVTRGAAGASMHTAETTLDIPALAITAIDTTGAGDCFVGVFAASLDRGEPPPQAARRATTAASLACTRPGTQASYPTHADIEAALMQHSAATPSQ